MILPASWNGKKQLLSFALLTAIVLPSIVGLATANQVWAQSILTSSDTGQTSAGRAASAYASAPIKAPGAERQTAGAKMAFEVASVRESSPGSPVRGKEFLVPFDVRLPKGGRLSANAGLFGYIVFAYRLLDTSQWPRLMSSLPKWAQDTQFAIEARAEGEPTTDQVRLMVQSLLEDRFKLIMHTETRQVPVYALALGQPDRLGPQLQPHSAPCIEKPDKPAPVAPGTQPPAYCGLEAWRQPSGVLHTRMLGVTMDDVVAYLDGAAIFLGGLERRPIVDRTGLSGKFDLNIEFTKDLGPDMDPESSGPTFSSALKKQLGLRLVKQTGAMPILVIDHVEKPSEN